MSVSTATVRDHAQDKPVAEIIRESNRFSRRFESGLLLFATGYCALLTYGVASEHQSPGIIAGAAFLCGAFAAGTLIRFTTND